MQENVIHLLGTTLNNSTLNSTLPLFVSVKIHVLTCPLYTHSYLTVMYRQVYSRLTTKINRVLFLIKTIRGKPALALELTEYTRYIAFMLGLIWKWAAVFIGNFIVGMVDEKRKGPHVRERVQIRPRQLAKLNFPGCSACARGLCTEHRTRDRPLRHASLFA